MKKNKTGFISLVVIAALAGIACNLSGLLNPAESTPLPTAEVSEATETTSPEITPTEAALSETPTDPPALPNDGQIAFASEGNIWLYAVSSGTLTQVTTGGIAESYENQFQNPHLSADGQHLAYLKNNISYIHNLEDGTVINLIHHGRFFEWTNLPGEFFATRGSFDCPALDNLDDQERIAFDVLRFSVDALDTPVVLGNISGGLRFPQAISNDGVWGSFLNCYCYSECGSYGVWHIATGVNQDPGSDEFYSGQVDFSPNATQLAVANHQMYGFVESPLFLANADFSGLHTIYFEAGEAPMNPHWSPDGEWIAFTTYEIDSTAMDASDSRVVLIRPDGSEAQTIAGDFANFLDWSPDSSKLLYSTASDASPSFYIYDLTTAVQTLLPISGSPYLDWGVLP